MFTYFWWIWYWLVVQLWWGATPSDKKVGWGGPTNQSATFTSSLPTTNNDQEEDGFEKARSPIGTVFMWAISIHLILQYLADSNLIFICSKLLWTSVLGSMGSCKSYEVGDQKVFGYMAMSRLRSTTLSVGVVWICKNVVMCSPPPGSRALVQCAMLLHSWRSCTSRTVG